MHDRKRRGRRDDTAMRIATAEAKHHDVAGLRIFDLATAIEYKAEITLLAAVQMPIRRIGPRIEWRTEPGVDKHADDQHAAIDASAFDVGAVVVWRANPGPRLGDHHRALLCFDIEHVRSPSAGAARRESRGSSRDC